MTVTTRMLAQALLATTLLAGSAGFALAETILNRGNGAEPSSLDVQKVAGDPELQLQVDLYEGLMTYGPAGNAVPGVAESYKVSDDGLTYTFKLRADAKWSDGSPVTAADFVFAWQRITNPKTAADYAYFLDQVVNAKDIRDGKKPVDSLGAKAIDDHTLEVKLVAPTPYFVSMLVHPATFPIDKALVEKAGDDYAKPGTLITNGAYTLVEAIPQDHITLKKNPYFHDAANVKIDTVRYFPTEDVDAELKRFKAGELDITYLIPAQQIPTLAKEMPKEVKLGKYFGTYYYAFNLTHEPWKSNLDLRRALSLAVDRDVITKNITQAGETPAYSFVPPGTSNFPAWTPDEAKMTQAERDAEAKKLFAKAGYGKDKPLTVEFLYNTNEIHKKVAVAVAAMWKQKLGVNVELKNEEWATFQADRNNKVFKDIARQGWIGDYNDANNFLELLDSTIGVNNPSAYSNPKFDALIAQAKSEADLAKRGQALQEAEKMMIADQAIIPLYTYSNKHMVSTKVTGWEINLMDFHPTRWLNITR